MTERVAPGEAGRSSERPAAVAGSFLFVLTVALELASVILSWGLEPYADTLAYAAFSVTMAGAGALIVSRHPRNAIGWILCALAVANAIVGDLLQGWALRAPQRGWPGAGAADLMHICTWAPIAFGLFLTFLLFPDGRLPSLQWRPLPWLGLAGICVALPGWLLNPDRSRELITGPNPLAIQGFPSDSLLVAGSGLFLLAFAASVAALVRRLLASGGIERQQLKWFTSAAALAVVALPATFVFWYTNPTVLALVEAVGLMAVPVAACVAILRYRLYDIDVIVDRTVVYATVTVILAATYGVTALVLGRALGRGPGWTTAASTLIVAVAFRPARDRIQDGVDRRFHRARHEAVRRMTDFLESVRAGHAAPQEVESLLQQLTDDPALRLLVFLPESRIYVDVNGVPRTHPGQAPAPRLDLERGGLPLGVVLPGATQSPDTTLLRRLVDAGGLAIEVTRLHVELRRQLAELQASRKRLITAQDHERRRLERNLHDGAQQQLIALRIRLRLAESALDDRESELGRALADLGDTAQSALDDLRDLARGLYPPLLADRGLVAALEAQGRKAALTVRVDSDGIGRYPQEVEAAVYFCSLEALQNVAKYAGAGTATLRLSQDDGTLRFAIQDDGAGFDPLRTGYGTGLQGMADRLSALGGGLRVTSSPGTGTTVEGHLPLPD